jgi:hypothetical protein
MMGVNPSWIVFDLPGFDLFQQVGDVFVVGQRHLDAHAVQPLHSWLAHTTANKHLAVADDVEFRHMGRAASRAVVVMVVIMIVVMMVMIARIRHLA